MERIKSEIIFGDEKLRKEFDKVAKEDKALQEQLIKAFNNLKEDAFCGIQIPKNLIPKEYISRYGNITNLWKYNLPNAWRLLYTIHGKIEVLSVIKDRSTFSNKR